MMGSSSPGGGGSGSPVSSRQPAAGGRPPTPAASDAPPATRSGAADGTLPTSPPDVSWTLLEGAVRRQLGLQALQLGEARFTPFAGRGGAAIEGIYRITGTARALGDSTATDALPWSLVAQVIRKPDPSSPVSAQALGLRHPEYWPREALAYSEQLTEGQPGLGAPRCFGVDAPSEDARVLWLESLTDERAGLWPLEHYGRAAQHLGEFNGAYLSGQRPLPPQPWLCTDYHHGRLDRFSFTHDVFAGDEFWKRPLVQRFMNGPTQVRQRQLLGDRAALQRRLDALPQTLSHNDAMRTNLLTVSREGQSASTVAIGWGSVGVSAIGTDAACLFGWAMGLTEVQERELRPLAQVVFDGYLQGLRAAGWQGGARTARAGFTAAAALHALMGTVT